jgi:aspartyl-tRNA(Asn)/glutamyl-tRNA(Gln) amidotransferase subunit A
LKDPWIGSDIFFAEITAVRQLIRTGKLSPRELFRAVLDRIQRCDAHLNAFISLNSAFQSDDHDSDQEKGLPLHGIPVSIKDLFLTKGTPTTAGSRVFSTGIAARSDAEIVRRLKSAGALILGKTNLHEFAYGITNENEHFGPTRNPWDTSRISGGSSGGSAAAVAAGCSYASIGSDTRGSIRIPSACCGISGLKPTYGSLSTQGLLPLSPSLDHAGPMARSVRDLELLFSVLANRGPSTRNQEPPEGRRLRLGICDYYFRNLHPETEIALEQAIQLFEEAGHSIRRVKVSGLDEALAASGQISSAEALFYHDPHLRRFPQGYGPSVRKRLEAGYDISALDYLNAMESRRRFAREFRRTFNRIDCLLGAVLPGPPPVIGCRTVDSGRTQEEVLLAFVRLNAPQNMARVPALAIPCGFTKSGLPIGMQLIANAHCEDVLFTLGREFQQRSDWHLRRPSSQ